MTPGKKFFVVALTMTLPLISLWTFFARDALVTVSAMAGYRLHPLVFFITAMTINLFIVQLTLGKLIAHFKEKNRSASKA